jgi:hypothetical protein
MYPSNVAKKKILGKGHWFVVLSALQPFVTYVISTGLGVGKRRQECSGTVAQDAREAMLRPGEFVLVDSRRPWRFGLSHDPFTVSLELPPDWVTRWLAEPGAHTARPFGHDDPGWAAAWAAFASE